jgi:trehalose/maltose hydrolase-like predicted phosphorylase
MDRALTPTADPGWVLQEGKYDPVRESGVESRFAVSNGFLGVRGARAISRGPSWVSWLHTLTWASWPRTYVAGLFDTPNTEPPVPALVPAADWLRIRILLNGERLLLRSGSVRTLCRTLDMRRGVLHFVWEQRDAAGLGVRTRTLRLVSVADRAIGLQLLRFELDQGGVEVTLRALFEGAGQGLEALQIGRDLCVWRTEQSSKTLAMAGTATLQLGESELPPSAVDPLQWSWQWTSSPGQVATLARLVAVARGDNYDNAGGIASAALDRARRLGWERVLADHETGWGQRWALSDIEIEGDEAAQKALRFAAYHLNSAANPADDRVSIGARALTGDAYLGHVFWDTEIYVLPFYVLTWPEAARTLLMYRFHGLGGARAKAARMGWRGALYAWESADTGEETTPETIIGPDGDVIHVLCGTQEQHISADVAYAVWQYWRATADDDFLLDAGAEILLETARFWASRARLETDGRHHIRGVIGPDEYHEDVDDNAYTNVMARWNIRRGLETAAMLQRCWPERWRALAERLALDEAELAQWHGVAETLVTGFDARTKLFEQFAGFFSLEEIDLDQFAGHSMPMDVVLGRKRTQASQVIKQADVVALLALLPEEFDRATMVENFRFYEPRCAHGSSLSPGMHAVVAARLGETELALRYFRQTAAIDLSDRAATSAGGVHIAAMGGLWQAAVLGFAGLILSGDAPAFDPLLPVEWRSMQFRLHWKGSRFKVHIEHGAFTATLEAGEPTVLVVSGRPYELARGSEISIGLAARMAYPSRAAETHDSLPDVSLAKTPGRGS